jgi:thiol-disulfide isomerase/thioredoxin
MKIFIRAKARIHFSFLILVFAFNCLFSIQAFSQAKKPASKNPSQAAAQLPKVTQIDEIKLKELTKPNGKPLLVNFWATWCDPCREEFPDLVKIDVDYKGKIDLITISLDDLAEINRDVPKFLAEMRAEMPSYLLKTDKEEMAITEVSKEWQGGLPFTILFNEKGETTYFKQGKFKPEVLRLAIDQSLKANESKSAETNSSLKVTAIDEKDLGKLIQANRKKRQPLFLSFWASWCKPCYKEFPAVARLYDEYRTKGVEFAMISVDNPSEIKKIPPILREVNAADLPAYLLNIKSRDAMFTLMPFWSGSVPFTLLYDTNGKVSFAKSGLVNTEALKFEIESALSPAGISQK